MGASNLQGPRFRSPFGGQVRLGFSGSETSAASGIKLHPVYQRRCFIKNLKCKINIYDVCN
jgi:hypothetical protein